MTCFMFMGNFVETGGRLKKLKHVSALACTFGRRVCTYKKRIIQLNEIKRHSIDVFYFAMLKRVTTLK